MNKPSKTALKLYHYLVKAAHDFKLIQHGDRVMVCLSGGKDSYTMLTLLNMLRIEWKNSFTLFAYTLDQSQPGWDDNAMRQWLTNHHISFEIKKHIVIRPMVYCQEADIKSFASEQQFPIIPCNLCGSQENLARKKMKILVETLAKENPKIPSNILHAMQSLQPSQLMYKNWWDFSVELLAQ